jgi:hypothetical protein
MTTSRGSDWAAVRVAPMHFWIEATAWSLLAAFAIAIPTVLIANSLFRRMTPTRWWDYVFLALSAPLIGLTLGARRLPGSTQCRTDGKTITGGGLTYLAVGCPICNKLVVALLGSSGALTYFAPVQPVLGGFAVILLLYSLREALGASFGPEVGAELQTLTSTDR